ncbi:MAG TPA: hypothetical protein VF532_20085 [Candidatus Angelobacter sp.]
MAKTRMEKTATVALAVSFLLLAASATRSYLVSRRPAPSTLPLIKIGETVKLPESLTGAGRPTLVMVLSSGCRYCVDDLPFYKELSTLRATSFRAASADGGAPSGGGTLRLVAVLPENTDTAETFLRSAGVTVDQVFNMGPRELGVQILPTLLLVDEHGKLQKYWVGELDQQRQREVVQALRQSRIIPE